MLLYSASNSESFLFVKQALDAVTSLENTFRLLVEMDNSEKQLNVVAGDGELLAQNCGLVFVRLNLYNS